MTPLFIGGIGHARSATARVGCAAVFRRQENTELMKGIGKGVRSFKDGMNNVEKEIDEIKDTERKE